MMKISDVYAYDLLEVDWGHKYVLGCSAKHHMHAYRRFAMCSRVINWQFKFEGESE